MASKTDKLLAVRKQWCGVWITKEIDDVDDYYVQRKEKCYNFRTG